MEVLSSTTTSGANSVATNDNGTTSPQMLSNATNKPIATVTSSSTASDKENKENKEVKDILCKSADILSSSLSCYSPKQAIVMPSVNNVTSINSLNSSTSYRNSNGGGSSNSGAYNSRNGAKKPSNHLTFKQENIQFYKDPEDPDNKRYQVSDHVYMDINKPNQPFAIACIIDFKLTKRDTSMVEVKWYFRPNEIPDGVYMPLMQDRFSENGSAANELIVLEPIIKGRELFASECKDIYPASYIKGKCRVVHFQDILDARNFKPFADTFFYILTYNPDARRLANTQGEIRVGASHQAKLPVCQSDMPPDLMPEKCELLETCTWRVDHQLDDEEMVQYLASARSITSFAGFCNRGSMEDLFDAAQSDSTTIYAMQALHEADYDVSRALQHLAAEPVPAAGLVDKKWTDEEQKKFVKGLRLYGKNFFRIRKELLSHRETADLIEFYYLWKKTPQGINSRPRRRVTRPSSSAANKNKAKKTNQTNTTSNADSTTSNNNKANNNTNSASNSNNNNDQYSGGSDVDSENNESDESSDHKISNSNQCTHCLTSSSKDFQQGGADNKLLCYDCRMYYKKYGELPSIESQTPRAGKNGLSSTTPSKNGGERSNKRFKSSTSSTNLASSGANKPGQSINTTTTTVATTATTANSEEEEDGEEVNYDSDYQDYDEESPTKTRVDESSSTRVEANTQQDNENESKTHFKPIIKAEADKIKVANSPPTVLATPTPISSDTPVTAFKPLVSPHRSGGTKPSSTNQNRMQSPSFNNSNSTPAFKSQLFSPSNAIGSLKTSPPSSSSFRPPPSKQPTIPANHPLNQIPSLPPTDLAQLEQFMLQFPGLVSPNNSDPAALAAATQFFMSLAASGMNNPIKNGMPSPLLASPGNHQAKSSNFGNNNNNMPSHPFASQSPQLQSSSTPIPAPSPTLQQQQQAIPPHLIASMMNPNAPMPPHLAMALHSQFQQIMQQAQHTQSVKKNQPDLNDSISSVTSSSASQRSSPNIFCQQEDASSMPVAIRQPVTVSHGEHVKPNESNAMFVRVWERQGGMNSCARTDLHFRYLPNAAYLQTKQNNKANNQQSSLGQSLSHHKIFNPPIVTAGNGDNNNSNRKPANSPAPSNNKTSNNKNSNSSPFDNSPALKQLREIADRQQSQHMPLPPPLPFGASQFSPFPTPLKTPPPPAHLLNSNSVSSPSLSKSNSKRDLKVPQPSNLPPNAEAAFLENFLKSQQHLLPPGIHHPLPVVPPSSSQASHNNKVQPSPSSSGAFFPPNLPGPNSMMNQQGPSNPAEAALFHHFLMSQLQQGNDPTSNPANRAQPSHNIPPNPFMHPPGPSHQSSAPPGMDMMLHSMMEQLMGAVGPNGQTGNMPPPQAHMNNTNNIPPFLQGFMQPPSSPATLDKPKQSHMPSNKNSLHKSNEGSKSSSKLPKPQPQNAGFGSPANSGMKHAMSTSGLNSHHHPHLISPSTPSRPASSSSSSSLSSNLTPKNQSAAAQAAANQQEQLMMAAAQLAFLRNPNDPHGGPMHPFPFAPPGSNMRNMPGAGAGFAPPSQFGGPGNNQMNNGGLDAAMERERQQQYQLMAAMAGLGVPPFGAPSQQGQDEAAAQAFRFHMQQLQQQQQNQQSKDQPKFFL